ncbi:MAG: hypothetical protein KatS3mg062_0889 [Tepidiforma sp.]|nr:MAG: hypothetical protein KatS3mg062_0889 [Tepidiforma sp.]
MPHYVHVSDGAHSWQESAVAGSPDGVLLVDEAGRIVHMNAAAERIFRVRAGEMEGRSVQEFVPSRFRDWHAGQMLEFVETAISPREMADRDPVPAVRADGNEFMAEIALIPVSSDGGRGTVCIVRDVTRRLELEAALRQAEKLESLRMLSAGLAHDFNNILSVIVGNADFARQFAEEGSPLRLALHDIREAALQAAGMVQQMMRFAGADTTARELLDLGTVVSETLQLLRGALGSAVAVRLDLPREAVIVAADPVGMRQVVMNLLMNASEAMAEGGGTLTVRLRRERVTEAYLAACRRGTCHGCSRAEPGDYAVVEVADTGKGMDAQTRERIFDPFFSTKFTGRGLGLAAVLGVVEAHRGAIHVESEPGRGTTFRVLLPGR